jgi:acetate kinase
VNAPEGWILSLNAGSSSLKFALHGVQPPHERGVSGTIDRIGGSGETGGHAAAGDQILDQVEEAVGLELLRGVGHRVVHGGPDHLAPEPVTPDLLADLRRLCPYDPDHLPAEIELMERFRERLGDLPQVACFDTAFHSGLPRVARLLPIPRRYEADGVRRYGFHGLSYEYLRKELERQAGPDAARGRVILAHLGSGASLAALRDGACIDTTMAFTPAAGLPMGTRSGDLDPGLVWYLALSEGMTPTRFQDMVQHRSGLLGISETTSDMRDLLAAESSDVRAAEAVAFFCYQTRKWIGAFTAALGGLDTLVLSGGIGENSSVVRARCLEGLTYLGLEVNEAANARNETVISTAASQVAVWVIPTDEELMIAQAVRAVLAEVRIL